MRYLNGFIFVFTLKVTLALPADTDTPGFAEEEKTKPKETKIISGSGGLANPKDVAIQILNDAMVTKRLKFQKEISLSSSILGQKILLHFWYRELGLDDHVFRYGTVGWTIDEIMAARDHRTDQNYWHVYSMELPANRSSMCRRGMAQRGH